MLKFIAVIVLLYNPPENDFLKNVHSLQCVCNINLQSLCVTEMYKAVGDQRRLQKCFMLSVGTVFGGTELVIEIVPCLYVWYYILYMIVDAYNACRSYLTTNATFSSNSVFYGNNVFSLQKN